MQSQLPLSCCQDRPAPCFSLQGSYVVTSLIDLGGDRIFAWNLLSIMFLEGAGWSREAHSLKGTSL